MIMGRGWGCAVGRGAAGEGSPAGAESEVRLLQDAAELGCG
jgi:hypothetical protein